MNNTYFKNLLKELSVTVVHFSHHATMNHSVVFPNDLKHAIENNRTETRSCCAVFPGHRMKLPGSVGIIFEPEYSHVISVCQSDSGSSEDSGKEGSLGTEPTEINIRESCLNVSNGDYNEWRIMGATPIGIYISDPNNICAKKKTIIPGCPDEDIFCMSIHIEEVRKAFPKRTLFTLGSQGLEVVEVSAHVSDTIG